MRFDKMIITSFFVEPEGTCVLPGAAVRYNRSMIRDHHWQASGGRLRGEQVRRVFQREVTGRGSRLIPGSGLHFVPLQTPADSEDTGVDGTAEEQQLEQ